MFDKILGLSLVYLAQAKVDLPSNLANAPKTGDDLVALVLNTVYFIAGFAAVISIIMGGFWYVTSDGDPGKAQRGKNAILYSSIGLVVILFAFGITGFVAGYF